MFSAFTHFGRLSATAVIILCLFSSVFAYSGGTGEPNNPYQIATPADLNSLGATSADWNKCFKLVADINMAGFTFDKAVIAPDISSFSGFQGTSFTGIFDGNGHKIIHLTINGGSKSYLGLFGTISNNGSVKNLGTEDFTVSGTSYVGCLVGSNIGSISNCYSTGAVVGGGSSSNSLGGLVGLNSGSIGNCYSTSAISGNSGYVGGLVGNNYGSIRNCYSTGAVSSSSFVGGLVGNNPSGTITACFWDTDTSGQMTSAGGTGMTTSQMQTAATFTSADWTFLSNSNDVGNWLMPENWYPNLAWEVYPPVSVPDLKGLTATDANMTLATAGLVQGESYEVYDLSVAAGTVSGTAPISGTIVYSGFTKVHLLLANDFRYAGGSGTQADPYQIGNYGNLQDLIGTPSDWNKYFIMTADIDMEWKVFTTAIIAPDTNPSSSSFDGTSFTGTFDGNGYKIIHFTITGGSKSSLGLFGQIGNGGLVKNLGIEDFTVSGYFYVGGLVGYNSSGNISNCYSIGAISGYQYVGGLVGYNARNFNYSYSANISNCYSTGVVSGFYDVGGLVGCNSYSTISYCYSTSAVSNNYYNVGGLVGSSTSSSIRNCYSTGAVSGGSSSYCVGGLVGGFGGVGSMSNCYSTGKVNGGSQLIGGLVGNNNDSFCTITGCFWDVNSSGLTTSAAGTGKTTAEMQTLSTFTDAGWNFFITWDIAEGQTYPFFKSGGNAGTPDDPYRIATKADLLMMAADTSYYGKCFILTADIDMAGQVFTTAIIALSTNLSSSFTGTAFTGTFDGNGHKITHFTINGGGNYYLGLFGQIGNGGSVKNLGVEDCTVSGYQYVSSLAGFNYGSISNCYSTGAVSGSPFVGGLVGCNWLGSISNCYSMGAVSGSSFAGGLVEYNNAGSISNCHSTGAVSGSPFARGLVGRVNEGSINNCFWDMDTSGQMFSAGGTGLNTLQMKQQASFVGWDFTTPIWEICDGTNYPKLAWQIPLSGDFGCPDGIDIYDLMVFAEQWLFEVLNYDLYENDGKHIVNFSDWAIFANGWSGDKIQLADFSAEWLKENAYSADIAPLPNGDGVVNMLDFAVFAENWMEE